MQRRLFSLASAVFAVAFLALTSCGGDLPPEDESHLITILGAKVIDGTTSAPVEDSVIVIDGTRIRNVGPRSHTPVPKGGERIDAAGKVIIPGLIDLHVHYFGDEAGVKRSLAAQLAWGVTTARSIGVDPAEKVALLRKTASEDIPGPRVYIAGLGFTHPQGHPIAQSIVNRPSTAEAARAMVQQLAAQKVDFIKIWVDSKYGSLPKITPEIRQAIVEEANQHHIPVVAHIFDEEDFYQLAHLGVRDFLHSVRDKEPTSAEFVRFVKENYISFTPTLTVIEHNWLFAEQPELVADPAIRVALASDAVALFENEQERKKLLENPELEILRPELEQAKRFVNQLHDEGAWLLVGSDSGTSRIPAGWGTHNELRLLGESGISADAVLRMATSEAARRLGDPNFGTLAAGKIADLVILNADPLEDINNTKSIDRVMQAGRWVDRSILQ